MKIQLNIPLPLAMLLFSSCFTGKKADQIISDRVNTTKEIVLQSEQTNWIADADTSFLLIAHDIQTAEIYGSFFTRENSVSFNRNRDLVFEKGITQFATFIMQKHQTVISHLNSKI